MSLLLVETTLAAHPPVDSPTDLLPALNDFCVRCHGGEKTKGKVDLKQFTTPSSPPPSISPSALTEHPELLEKMIDALRFEEMPPEEETQPTVKQRASWITQLQSLLNNAVAQQDALPRTPMRRMNRFEYNNAVRDLFKLRSSVFSLPESVVRDHSGYFQPASGKMPETLTVGNRPMGKSQMIEPRLLGVHPFPQDQRAEHGFNNRGDHISLSPILMESFLGLSRSIVNAENFAEYSGLWDDFFAAPQAATDSTRSGEIRAIAKDRLGLFLRRAFRGPVDESQLARYMKHYDAMVETGVVFEERMKTLAAVALVSPRFLYVYTQDHGVANADLDLASRLALYLWSGLPDEELLTLAEQGRLSDPGVLLRQVERMTLDPRIKQFCDSFPSQWLQMDRLIGALPDPDRYPEYYFLKWHRGMHAMLEPLLIFETVFIENLPITQLIDSDFTYRSEMLGYWYRPEGIPKKIKQATTKLPFKRIPITDRRFGGVITNAAVMTMTSSPLRTQPITRGAWIAPVIFNNPPEPPPAEVPPLDEDDEKIESTGLTLRQQLDLHRERADCSGCHQKIDPLGFALENYDPVGRWRDTYRSGLTIDTAGELFNKHAFADPIAFKDAILAEKDVFARALAEHLLAYALGRALAPQDTPSIDQILANTVSQGYRLKDLIRQVALSPSFTRLGNLKLSE